MSIDWKKKLSKIKDFEAAKKSSESIGGSVPDGQYTAKMDTVELAESQSSGREQINIFCTITQASETDLIGQPLNCFPGLDEEKSLPFTLAMLRALGFEIEEPEQIVDAVESLAEQLPEVLIRVKKGFTSILGRADASSEESGEEVAAEENVEEPVAEETPEIEVGSEVTFVWKGEDLEGVVKVINDDGSMKISSGGKVYPVKAEAVQLKEAEVAAEEEPVVEEEPVAEEPEEEPEPVKRKPAARKPAPKPVKKPVGKVNRKR